MRGDCAWEEPGRAAGAASQLPRLLAYAKDMHAAAIGPARNTHRPQPPCTLRIASCKHTCTPLPVAGDMTGVKDEPQNVQAGEEAQPMQQEAQEAGAKRKAADEPAAEAQPAAKEGRTEEGDAAEASGGDAGEAEAAEAAQEAQEPVTIGYKTFASGKEAKDYFHTLISKLRKYQNLNDVRGGRV